MVSTRDVIGLAVSVLDAVDAPGAPRSQDLPTTFEAMVARGDLGGGESPEAGHQSRISFDLDLLAAEIRPLIAAMERHLQLVLAARPATVPAPAPVESSDGAGLTGRELEALDLLANGLTAAAAARRMGCSLSTANKHFGNVYRKLGVGDRLAAVLEAQRRGILLAVPAGARSAAR